MSKVKISAVSYTNTIPFIYGIERSKIIDQIELSKDVPSVCAKKLLENNVDIGLIPVAAIPELSYMEIISDFCIGASATVRSVILASYKPINDVETIYLDYQSRSSVLLTRILAKKYWHIYPEWANTNEGFIKRIKADEAAVIIGDKALHAEKMFPFVYDLAEEWIKYTNLPFVFAAWVANKKIGDRFKIAFNNALKQGVHDLDNVLKAYDFTYLPDYVDPGEYLRKNIDFEFDLKKKEGLKLFLKLAEEIEK